MIIVQLVDANGVPSPARDASVKVNIYSSNLNVANAQGQVAIPYGKSHVEVAFSTGVKGTATITGVSDGYNPASAKVTVSLFNGFALAVTLMNSLVLPGDATKVRVELLASGSPYDTPASVPVTLATTLPGTEQQIVTIQPGSCCAYGTITIPSGVNASQTPFATVSAAASGFTSSQAALQISPTANVTASLAVVGPAGASLVAGTNQYLSVALFSQRFGPTAGSATLSLFSSNASVIDPLVSQVTITRSDSAIFQVYAGAAGSAQVTAVAPGLTPIPLTVTVVDPYKPELRVFVPSEIRGGEQYSFAAEFIDQSGMPITYGPTIVYVYSSSPNILVPSSLQIPSLGYATGTLTITGSASANITAVLQGMVAGTARTTAVVVPLVAPVAYTVTAASYSGPLRGMSMNFSYAGVNETVLTNQRGVAAFRAHNDSATLVTVPDTYSVANRTFYFTGWSDGAKKTTTAMIGSGGSTIEAQYFRSIVPTAYTLLAVGDGGKPIAGLRFNITSGKGILSLTTGSSGEAVFVLPNATSFKATLPTVYQPSGGTKYDFLSLMSSTKNAMNFTSSSSFTVRAEYATYYSFTVVSPIGTAAGSGWYRSSSNASYSISETSSGGPLVYQRFTGWTGSLSSDQPSGSLLMDGPKSIIAQWALDNSMLFAAAGGAVAAAAIIGFFIFRVKKRGEKSA